MKFLLFGLLAVSCCCCCCLCEATMTRSEGKLREVLKELRMLKKSLQHSVLMLNTPPQNIEECCCLSALQCFRENLMQLNVTNKVIHVKLGISLRSPLTENSLNFCNSAETKPANCRACNSQPRGNSTEFILRLESLIQRALVRLADKRQNPLL